jgi:hypothetical protein
MKRSILSLSLLFICSLDALAGIDIDAYGLRLGYGSESGNDLFSAETMFYFDYEREWGDDWTLGYRFQHISNAGLKKENPGLNFHALAIARGF